MRELIAVCLVGLIVAVAHAPPAVAEGAVAAPTPVIVAPVRLADFADRIEALGTLRANESVALTAAVTETVSAVHFDDGERVKAGQVLVEMTSAEESAQLAEARASADEAYRQYQRVLSLENQGTAAKSLLDERRREWETARARRAAIESRLADRIVKAPFAGVLGLRDLSPGALVRPGDLIAVLDDDAVMKLEFQIPSTYLDVLAPGLEIIATAPAFAQRQFRGQVKSIDSRIDTGTRAIRVRALLPNPERLLKPGLLMQLELLKRPRRAIVIPEEALLALGEKQFVLVVAGSDDNKVVRRQVEIGGRRPGEVEIVAGLTAGEQVITHGGLKVRPGDRVEIAAIDDGSLPLPDLLRRLPGGGT